MDLYISHLHCKVLDSLDSFPFCIQMLLDHLHKLVIPTSELQRSYRPSKLLEDYQCFQYIGTWHNQFCMPHLEQFERNDQSIVFRCNNKGKTNLEREKKTNAFTKFCYSNIHLRRPIFWIFTNMIHCSIFMFTEPTINHI